MNKNKLQKELKKLMLLCDVLGIKTIAEYMSKSQAVNPYNKIR